MSYDYTSDYVRDRSVAKPDHSYEDILIGEVRKLEEQVATLTATVLMVRRVLGNALVGDPAATARILAGVIDALDTVPR
jgi:hypothetical protein